VIACPSCGEENPDRARFCLACRAAIAAEPRRKERKYATALFADLVGSTTLAEREDPEVVQAVVGRTFDRLSEEIQRHEGLLEKFMGDAVLAVFGVPRAHEDDAERAVRAAIEMQAILSELNRGFASEGKPQLAMRIGVEAGEVLVDQERASGPRDRMLTGDAVNTAARLQTAADPGRVVVGPGVYGATKDVVEYRELPALELKGKAEPVPAWDALRIKAKVRGERPHLGMEANLVGRDEELAVLTQTLRRVQTEGRPALVTIVGPAGVGKSRLVRELEKHVEALPDFVYWRRGRCLAYGNISYSALADAIKAQCEILDDDPAEIAGRKADAAVRELFGDGAVAPTSGRWSVRASPARLAERSCSKRGGGSWSGWRRDTRWWWPSRTCTGPTPGCSTSWSTSPIGRRVRSWWSRSLVPSSSTRGLPGAAASATRPRSTSIRSRPRKGRRCCTISCRATCRPSCPRRSSNAARATPSTSRRSSAC
jgi:class 3 adenylate cyclase